MGAHRTASREELQRELGRMVRGLTAAVELAESLGYRGTAADLEQLLVEVGRVHRGLERGQVHKPLTGQMMLPTT